MTKSISILLAEDDVNLGHLLQAFLKSKSFEVSLAQNGKIAFDKFNKNDFDFCIFGGSNFRKLGFNCWYLVR